MANVKVAVRARPLLPREIESQSPVVVQMRENSTILFKTESAVAVGELRDASKEFVYDHSYWSVNPDDSHFANQEKIFSDLGQHILDSAFEGYNGCMFAYGQTGSGKTYTMMGNEGSPGLIPRICQGLFSNMNTTSSGQVSYKVEVSYMEIYNEKVRDLLRESSVRSPGTMHNLRVREHPKEGPYVENLSKQQVSDYQAIEELIAIGNSHRVTAATKMNDVSSRSHAIFTITFVQAKYYHGLPSETVSKIHLVDLAGSERASQTGAEGQRLKEGGSINKSLVCLGNVIQALADISSGPASKRKGRYIPYRDSVLTWLLKDSLGGNSKTIMIATVSPCQYSYAETLSTLRYASRAKSIVNKPKINEDENVKTIRELREEIRKLKEIIARGDGFAPENSLLLAANLHDKEEKMFSLTRDWAGKWENIQKIMEEHDVALKSEGLKMTLASEQPHLLGVDDDQFSAGVVLYYIKNDETTIGHINAAVPNDIALKPKDIEERHCKIVLTSNDMVFLHKLDGMCFVNQVPVEEDQPVKLSHGDTVKLGSSYFRFNHPREAAKLKESLIEPNRSRSDSYASTVWSPTINSTSGIISSPALNSTSGSVHSEKLLQLEQERDALRQRQSAIEQEYEEKIRTVEEQLKKEAQDKAELMKELERLKQEKVTASLSISRSLSIPTTDQFSTSAPPTERYILPVIPSPTPSESDDNSIDFDPNFPEREVLGEENPKQRTSSPLLTEENYPYEPVRRHTVTCGAMDIHQLSVSLCDNGEVEISNMIHKGKTNTEEGEDYIMLETDRSRSSSSSGVSDPDMAKRIAEQEKEELKEMYEERLKREAKEKEDYRKQLLEMELQMQLSAAEQAMKESSRSRASAVVTSGPESSFDRSLPQYHSHRPSRIKLCIPAFYLRGYGWSSYHVYEIHLKVGHDEWSVYRKYEQFRDFHNEMKITYPELSTLNLPPSKWFGTKNETFVRERKVQLERYLKAFMALVTAVSNSPLSESRGKKVTAETLRSFHSFFRQGSLQATLLI